MYGQGSEDRRAEYRGAGIAIMAIMMAVSFVLLTSTNAGAINKEHLERLKQTGHCLYCDLSKADLRKSAIGRNLHKANLRGATLKGANLIEANLQGANLFEAKLQSAFLARANLRDVNLGLANLQDADLKDANLQKAYFPFAKLQKAILSGANLQGATLVGAKLQGAFLSNANLSRADLRGAFLNNARLVETNLAGAKFSKVDLTGATYEPSSAPHKGFLGGIEGLMTVKFGPAGESGIVLLRAALKKAGLTKLERQATYIIERRRTERAPWAEAAFKVVFFELTSEYGESPGQPLRILLGLIGIFTMFYMAALRPRKEAGIWRVWPKERVLNSKSEEEKKSSFTPAKASRKAI